MLKEYNNFMRKKLAPILMGLFAITNLIMVSSCRHETILVEVSKGMSDTIYFDTQVLPIFQNKNLL